MSYFEGGIKQSTDMKSTSDRYRWAWLGVTAACACSHVWVLSGIVFRLLLKNQLLSMFSVLYQSTTVSCSFRFVPLGKLRRRCSFPKGCCRCFVLPASCPETITKRNHEPLLGVKPSCALWLALYGRGGFRGTRPTVGTGSKWAACGNAAAIFSTTWTGVWRISRTGLNLNLLLAAELAFINLSPKGLSTVKSKAESKPRG